MTTKNIRVLLVDEGLAGMISVPMEAYSSSLLICQSDLKCLRMTSLTLAYQQVTEFLDNAAVQCYRTLLMTRICTSSHNLRKCSKPGGRCY